MMKKQVISALFESLPQAERAIAEMRGAGAPEGAISVVTLRRDEDQAEGREQVERLAQQSDTRMSGAAKGAAAGGAIGAIAGLAALAIPGLGPFIAAGAIGEAFGPIGSALLMSGAVGATAGGLATALVNYGIDEKDALKIEQRIRQGATLVIVELESVRDCTAARAVLRAAGGETTEPKPKPDAAGGIAAEQDEVMADR